MDIDNSMIELSQEAVVAGPEGGEFTITVNSSDDWRIAGFSDWVSFESESGKSGSALKMTVAPNEGKDPRTAEFKVFAGSAEKLLSVSSTPDMFIELAKNETISVRAEASSFTVGVKTNSPEVKISYSEGDETWISNTGKIEGFSGKTMYEFKTLRTDKYKPREAKVFFQLEGSDTVVETNLVQAQLDTVIIVEGSSIIKGIDAVDFELNVRSNVEFQSNFPDWIQQVDVTTSEVDDEGLKTTTYSLHCDATSGSRGENVRFTVKEGWYSKTVGKVLIKQQNPHPTFMTIPDKVLRNNLIELGWILLEDEESGKCEIISKGLESTSLIVAGDDSWNLLNVKSFDGLEQFPKLTSLTLKYMGTQHIDLSNMTNITSLSIISCQEVISLNTGDMPIKDLKFSVDDYGYQLAKEITVTSNKAENFDFSAAGYYIANFEELVSLDVTGMPNLKTLNAKRYTPGRWGNPDTPAQNFTTIFMTEAQKAAVAVECFDTVSVVVK